LRRRIRYDILDLGDLMGDVIAVANQKGGVGKTTTNINLSACLAQAGCRVLTVDIDPQGNSTSGLGIDKKLTKFTTYDVLLGQCYLQQAIIPTAVKNLDIIPSNIDLAGAEIELVDFERREYLLKDALNEVRYIYDYILIDCPPSLSMLTINAMTAADSVLVPIQCEYYALEGLSQLLFSIDLVQRKLNPELIIEGVVFTMFDARTNLSLEVVEHVKEHLVGKNIYKSVIPRNVRLSEAPSHGLPITVYDSRSKGAESYTLLAQEVINRRNAV